MLLDHYRGWTERRVLNDYGKRALGHISKNEVADKEKSIYRNLNKDLRHECKEVDKDQVSKMQPYGRSYKDGIELSNFVESTGREK